MVHRLIFLSFLMTIAAVSYGMDEYKSKWSENENVQTLLSSMKQNENSLKKTIAQEILDKKDVLKKCKQGEISENDQVSIALSILVNHYYKDVYCNKDVEHSLKKEIETNLNAYKNECKQIGCSSTQMDQNAYVKRYLNTKFGIGSRCSQAIKGTKKNYSQSMKHIPLSPEMKRKVNYLEQE